ncbi:M20/M25/M40 family metallo-hydrolase [Actinoalloteichus spitiensis]|uniref:M20/M25/M40 family metallo-hydrolase n=1 Tax=Actinoalloteichus spitiensis TaxID=252394 RepID=UPI000369F918|nr:M20/M25/M40 family metallo-hydrolase [Actinoalloteichus spitiensis]
MDPAELCARLIRFDTSNRGGGDAEGERDAAEFVAGLLSDAGYAPVVLESAPRRSNVVVRVPGEDRDAPGVLVHGHLDVVPADPALWSVDPFAGEVRDGFVWGRGAVDMKDMCAMVVSVLVGWAREGRRPRRDVVVAFVADEEDNGEFGAGWLVKNHAQLFEGCAAAISESGGVSYEVEGVRLYPVGTAERGTAHMRVTATGRAGHGSRRNEENAVHRLVAAVHRVAEYEWPVQLTPTVREFLVRTSSALGVRCDLEDVPGTVERLGAAGALVASTVRNSVTPTVLSAGYKVNVVPSTAVAELDARALPGSGDDLLATVDRLLGPGVSREQLVYNPAVESPVDSPWFESMAEAVRAEDPEAVVVPYCLGGGTDAKSFAKLGIHGYGFSPLRVPAGYDYRAMAHGVDERVPVAGLEFGVRVLDRFLLGC